MDRRELEIMLNEAFDRGIVSVGHLVHETVEVGFLNELGRTVGFTLNGWKEAIETIPVDLFDSFDDGRGRERFLSDCKALGGKVPQNTYRGELVSALADVLMVEEAAPALGALESALDSARRKGYCVFDRGVHGDVPADGLVYLCSTYPAAVGLKDSLDSVRAQGNGPDTRTLGVYRMVDGYCIMGGLDSGSQADAYAVDADLAEGWGVGDAAFRIADLKAKTFSYAVEAGEAQGASTLVYYTDEGADPVLFQQTDGDWRLASDNFLAENAIVEDLERVYTGEVSPVYLDSRIVDMEEMAEAYGWVRPERTPASIADVAEAYARALADGWTLPRIGRAYDTYRREYAASHTDGRYIMSLPKFLAAGNGLRFYDLRADLVDSGAVAAAEEKAAPSKAPTREQVRKYVHEKGYDAPDPDNPAYRVLDPDEFFDYYEATGWVRAGGVPIVRWKNVVNTWRRKPAPRSARKSGPSGAKRAMSVAERVAADSDFSDFNDD